MLLWKLISIDESQGRIGVNFPGCRRCLAWSDLSSSPVPAPAHPSASSDTLQSQQPAPEAATANGIELPGA